MKILQTISGMGINSGGPTVCLYNLVKGIKNIGVDITLLTFQPGKNDALISTEDFIKTVKSPKENRYGWSTDFKNKMQQFKKADIIHANGLWQFTSHASSVFAHKNNIPYLISPHGMLYPEGLKKSALLKKIALPLYQRKDLEMATVIHATCKQEMEYIRELGFATHIAVIPNAIDIHIPQKIEKLKTDKKQVGFLGRFAPIKNLETLLEAWAETGKTKSDWELVLIGDGDPAYKNSLIQLAKKLAIENIRFTGFLKGEEKEITLQSLNYLVLPSKSENFGMVVTEALIREIPVLASKGTPWEELNTHNAGWWIEIGVQPLVQTLQKAMQMNDIERRIMGQNGRKLVEENYSIESVASKMIQLYQWILTEGEKPEFVNI